MPIEPPKSEMVHSNVIGIQEVEEKLLFSLAMMYTPSKNIEKVFTETENRVQNLFPRQ